jgi:hypothetical protein
MDEEYYFLYRTKRGFFRTVLGILLSIITGLISILTLIEPMMFPGIFLFFWVSWSFWKSQIVEIGWEKGTLVVKDYWFGKGIKEQSHALVDALALEYTYKRADENNDPSHSYSLVGVTEGSPWSVNLTLAINGGSRWKRNYVNNPIHIAKSIGVEFRKSQLSHKGGRTHVD